MGQQPQVLVYDGEHVPDDWRRFIAALCFIEFWITFQENGLWLWQQLQEPSPWASSDENLAYLISSTAGLCRALCFWALGRDLWRGYQRAGRQILAIVICSIFVVWSSITVELGRLSSGPDWNWTVWGMELNATSDRRLYIFLRVLLSHLSLLPWAFLAIWAAWFLRRRGWREGCRSPWITAAGTLCLSATVLSVAYYGPWWNLGRFLFRVCSADLYLFLQVLYIGLPALCCLWLFFAHRGLWLVPLVIAVLNLLEIVAAAEFWVPRVICADGSPRYVWNQRLFWSLFFTPVAQAGPWLLIVLWARAYPARVPSGDGSPFPHRFCGRCHYNLHGTASQRCPECGNAVAPQSQPDLDFSAR